MTTEEQTIQALGRASLTAVTYFADLPDTDPGFDLAAEAAWCLEPLGELDPAVAADLLDWVQRVVVDPTANRETFIALLKSLEEDSPGE